MQAKAPYECLHYFWDLISPRTNTSIPPLPPRSGNGQGAKRLTCSAPPTPSRLSHDFWFQGPRFISSSRPSRRARSHPVWEALRSGRARRKDLCCRWFVIVHHFYDLPFTVVG